MDIDHTAVVLRRRWPFEAIDLGFEMARRFWHPLLVTQLLAVLPLALLANAVLAFDPVWAVLVVWWLKPLFELPPLYVLSRAFFGHTLRPTQALLATPWPGPGGLLRMLLWRRVSPWRAMLAPVEALEGLSGAARNGRANVLLRNQGLFAAGLTFVALGAEIALVVGVLVFVRMLLPDGVDVDPEVVDVFSADASPAVALLVSLLYTLAVVAVMPFYVAAGFALYLNRRVELEGWDIDLAFRRLAKRVSQGAGIAAALFFALFVSASVHAGEPDTEGPAPTATSPELRAIVDGVLAEADFGGEETRTVWRFVGDERSDDESGCSHSPARSAAASQLPSQLLGSLLAYLVGALGVVLAVAVLLALWRQREAQVQAAARSVRKPPTTLFGLDIRPESLPEDICAAAAEAWQRGHYQEALSILYRGALSHLAAGLALDIPKSATEGECVQLVQKVSSASLGSTFAELTSAWQQTAYGSHPVSGERFASLLRSWQQHFWPPACGSMGVEPRVDEVGS